MNALARVITPELDLSDLRRTITEVEQNAIGAALTNQAMFSAIFNRIGEGRFYDPFHRSVWAAMCECAKLALPVVPHTLANRLPQTKIGEMTVAQYLARLYAETSLIPQAVEPTMTWLMELWSNHALIEKMDAIRAKALSPDARTRDLTTDLLEEVDVIRAALDRGGRKDRGLLADFVGSYIEELKGRLDGSTVNPAIMTGLHDLDGLLGGILPETLMVMAGRPGMGKTVGATTIALRAAQRGKRVAFFSLEMGHRQIVPRCLSYLLYGTRFALPYQDIIKADSRWLRREHMEAIEHAYERLKSWPLALDMIAAPTVAEITSRCRSAADALGGPLDLIVVDYLGLMAAGSRYAGSKVNETAEITAGLKALTNRTGTPIILVCQLSRGVEQRNDKRPMLSDLRDSGSIEQDADVVVFPYRDAYYLDPMKDAEEMAIVQHKVEMIVAKNRHGSTGSVDLFANVACSIFDNLDGRH